MKLSNPNKATDEQKNLINAGVNINIPKSTWLYMGATIVIAATVIIGMLILRDKLKSI